MLNIETYNTSHVNVRQTIDPTAKIDMNTVHAHRLPKNIHDIIVDPNYPFLKRI